MTLTRADFRVICAFALAFVGMTVGSFACQEWPLFATPDRRTLVFGSAGWLCILASGTMWPSDSESITGRILPRVQRWVFWLSALVFFFTLLVGGLIALLADLSGWHFLAEATALSFPLLSMAGSSTLTRGRLLFIALAIPFALFSLGLIFEHHALWSRRLFD